MQQPSLKAEILGIWGVFSLDSGRWISSNSAVESSILDMLRLHLIYSVKSKLFVYCDFRMQLAERSSHSPHAIYLPFSLKLWC